MRLSTFGLLAAAALLVAYASCSPPTAGIGDEVPGDDPGGTDDGGPGGDPTPGDDDPGGGDDPGGTSCDPGVEFPSREDCNARDDDCDGEVDEEIGPRGPCETECGFGQEVCVAGEWVCELLDPLPEDCNSIDDDCDGEVDEDLGRRPCFTVCGMGFNRCVAGAWICDVALPMPELCDNRDNDCDGEIDEDIERDCPCGMGVEVCDHGAWVGDCMLCTPGAMRWCDEPSYCGWGQQVCSSDGRWGSCEETTARPSGCDSTFYDTACCVDAGECCQDFAHGSDASVGECEDECSPGS